MGRVPFSRFVAEQCQSFLSVFSSVDAFVDEFESKEEHLDMLIYNAAVANGGKYRTTADGFEET